MPFKAKLGLDSNFMEYICLNVPLVECNLLPLSLCPSHPLLQVFLIMQVKRKCIWHSYVICRKCSQCCSWVFKFHLKRRRPPIIYESSLQARVSDNRAAGGSLCTAWKNLLACPNRRIILASDLHQGSMSWLVLPSRRVQSARVDKTNWIYLFCT